MSNPPVRSLRPHRDRGDGLRETAVAETAADGYRRRWRNWAVLAERRWTLHVALCSGRTRRA